MSNQNFTESKIFRIGFSVIFLASVIYIFTKGYALGEWLYSLTH